MPSHPLFGAPFRRVFLALLLALSATVTQAYAQAAPTFATPGKCEEGSLAGGAKSLMCVPSSGWNGNLVVFAHGYVSPSDALTFANLDLADGTRLPDLMQKLGFAFATTTYRRNGLVILEGVDDIVELVHAFSVRYPPPAKTFLTGASEGGLVTALAAEDHPDLFDAALATCGPVGNFLFQISYVGDFRVLFDAYFPNVLPGSPVDIPAGLQANWDRVYVPAVQAALKKAPARARELMKVAGVPFDPKDETTIARGAVGLLWYNVLGTNDAKVRLGGNPFGNRFRWYAGSTNDLALNLRVKRIDADVTALLNARQYSTTGDVRIPIVTLHTTGDELIPYAHELLYAAKARTSNRGRLLPLPILRYGHCAFTTSEVLTGFALMLGSSLVSTPPSNAPVARLESSWESYGSQ